MVPARRRRGHRPLRAHRGAQSLGHGAACGPTACCPARPGRRELPLPRARRRAARCSPRPASHPTPWRRWTNPVIGLFSGSKLGLAFAEQPAPRHETLALHTGLELATAARPLARAAPVQGADLDPRGRVAHGRRRDSGDTLEALERVDRARGALRAALALRRGEWFDTPDRRPAAVLPRGVRRVTGPAPAWLGQSPPTAQREHHLQHLPHRPPTRRQRAADRRRRPRLQAGQARRRDPPPRPRPRDGHRHRLVPTRPPRDGLAQRANHAVARRVRLDRAGVPRELHPSPDRKRLDGQPADADGRGT